MNYNIIDNVIQYCDIQALMKLIEIYKPSYILWLIGRERLINCLFDEIAVIDIIKTSGPDQGGELFCVDIYDDEKISHDDKTHYLDVVQSINSLKSTDIYSCVYWHNDGIDLEKWFEYYNYCLKYKVF